MAKRKPKLDTKHESQEASESIGKRKKFTKHDLCNLQPSNLNQEAFLRLVFDEVPLITATGPAGTGKTFLAIYAALGLVLDESTPYDKIILIRSAVEARQQGFVKGDLEDKNAPYEPGYHQITQKLMPAFKEGYKHLKDLGYLEFHTTGYLRSQTFDRSIIICDEMQNCDYDELSTILTRVGDYSRIIFVGDSKQDDLKRKRGETSGFERFQRVVSKMPDHMHGNVTYTLDDIVRSGLVREFLIADYHTS